MKPRHLLLGLMAIVCSSFAAEVVTHGKLVAYSQDDAAAKIAIGKSVQVVAIGKGELGYFAKKGDGVTFACDSGDKVLTSYKVSKGSFQGTVVKSTWWEGTTVWSLKDCQFVTGAVASTAGAVPTQGTPAAAPTKKSYQAGNKSWSGVVEVVGNDQKATVKMEADSQGGTCSVEGSAVYADASRAVFKSSDDASCTAELSLAGDVMSVKSKGCDGYCGARGPGFDHAYKLKR